jgi:steroid 5-alpha reductase family enzyme
MKFRYCTVMYKLAVEFGFSNMNLAGILKIFPLYLPSFFSTFWQSKVQAFWVFLISLPLLVVQATDGLSSEETGDGSTASLTTLDKLALVGMAVGILMEIVADIQKAMWVEKGRPGGFCTVGLWSVSRHPNYAGEMIQWWCAWIVAYGAVSSTATTATSDTQLQSLQSILTSGIDLKSLLENPWMWWILSSLSPLFTMHILLNVPGTGVAHAEGKNLKRYYDSEYGDAYKKYRCVQ